MTIRAFLLLLALLCFLFSAFGVSSRVNLQSAGLALLVAALFFL